MKKRALILVFIISLILSVSGQIRVETVDYLSYIHRDSLKRTMQDLENFTTRYALSGNKHVAEYIKQRLVNYGVSNAIIDSFYIEREVWFDNQGIFSGFCYNVRGSITGTQNPDSIVIIGAHLDAVNLTTIHDDNDFRLQYLLNKDLSPGADDNASGVAIMIEMARIIHQYNLKPQNRIDLLAFDAEEIGLLGSAYDAERRVTEKDNVIIMINNDMVSYQPIDTNYIINIHWYDNAIAEAFHAYRISQEYSTIITPFIPFGYANYRRSASDSWAYAQRGFKAVFFIEHFFNPYYHTQYDLCENANFEYIEEVGKINFALLNYYAKFDKHTIDVEIVKNREHFYIYPNPVQQTASVAIPSSMYNALHILQIFDAYGRLCYQTTLTQQRTPIDFSEFTSGLYMVQIIAPDGSSHSKKILKK